MPETLTQSNSPLALKSLINWSSFEQFRTEGAKALSPIKDGVVASLSTKTGQYRILEEHDFQKLLGLARDVERLRGGLRLVMQAARVVQKHPDADSLNLLTEAVTVMGSLPELPVRESFEDLLPEYPHVDSDDEVDLDPNNIVRPFQPPSS
jgi:hypothetical protein